MLDIGVFRDAGKVWNAGTIQRSNLAASGTEDLGGGPPPRGFKLPGKAGSP